MMTEATPHTNNAELVNRIVTATASKRKKYPYEVALLNLDTGIEQTLCTFAYAGDAHVAGQAIAGRNYPAGEWLVIVRNAK